jgi:predicted DNA binding CopG/RHH family protein
MQHDVPTREVTLAINTAVVSCRLPTSEAEAFRAAATERGVPLQQFIREAMQAELRRDESGRFA